MPPRAVQNPIDLGVVQVVLEAVEDEVIGVDFLSHPNQLGLMMGVPPQRDDGETFVILPGVGLCPVGLRPLFVEDIGSPGLHVHAVVDPGPVIGNREGLVIAPQVLRQAVQLVEGCPHGLALIDLPPTHPGGQSAVFLVVQRRKFQHLEHLQVVQVEEAEGHAAAQRRLARLLEPGVEVSPQPVLRLALPGHTIAQQILVDLGGEDVEKVGGRAVHRRHRVHVGPPGQVGDGLLVLHGGGVPAPVVIVRDPRRLVQRGLLVLRDRLPHKLRPRPVVVRDGQKVLIGQQLQSPLIPLMISNISCVL